MSIIYFYIHQAYLKQPRIQVYQYLLPSSTMNIFTNPFIIWSFTKRLPYHNGHSLYPSIISSISSPNLSSEFPWAVAPPASLGCTLPSKACRVPSSSSVMPCAPAPLAACPRNHRVVVGTFAGQMGLILQKWVGRNRRNELIPIYKKLSGSYRVQLIYKKWEIG